MTHPDITKVVVPPRVALLSSVVTKCVSQYRNMSYEINIPLLRLINFIIEFREL